MTNKVICAVKDRAIDAYGGPIFTHTTAEAIRSFRDELNRPESVLGKHAEDYDLYVIGEYDERTGEIKVTRPTQIAIGKDLIERG